jgi:serpin B
MIRTVAPGVVVALSLAIVLAHAAHPSNDGPRGFSGPVGQEGLMWPRPLNALTSRLVNALAEEDGNAVVSPCCVYTALAMVYQGAEGETAEGLARAIGVDEPASLEGALAAIRAATAQAQGEHGVELKMASALWCQTGWPLRPGYRRALDGLFQAAIYRVDFSGKPEAARVRVNTWAAENTRGLITDVVPAGGLAGARLALASAIYFDGKWSRPFDVRQTAERPFRIAQGRTIGVPMMTRSDVMGFYKETEAARSLELNYAGNDFSMVVVLPAEGTEPTAVPEDLVEHLLGIGRQPRLFGQVQLPKFSVSSSLSLRPALAGAGATAVFDPKQADFGLMSPEPGLFVTDVYQGTVVHVDEEGTQAAATAVVAAAGEPIPSFLRFLVNRPFWFAILHHPTNVPLFVGHVLNPVMMRAAAADDEGRNGQHVSG